MSKTLQITKYFDMYGCKYACGAVLITWSGAALITSGSNNTSPFSCDPLAQLWHHNFEIVAEIFSKVIQRNSNPLLCWFVLNLIRFNAFSLKKMLTLADFQASS